MSEFVEIRGELDVEDAIAQAVAELGLESAEQAEVEVVTAGRKPIFGRFGGAETLVRARPKPEPKKRRRRRRGKGGGGQESGQATAPQQNQPQKQQNRQGNRQQPQGQRPQQQGEKRPPRNDAGTPPEQPEGEAIAGQAERVEAFLAGLVASFGLETSVTVETEGDVILASVSGEQAEALVGQKGVVMAAVQEVTRTVVQRRFHQPARVRVDIAGYRERRRQALAIYAERLANQVLDEGGEIMLEPMNAADRKVVHDTVSAIDGVNSYSEGEDPRRSVVIAKLDRSEEE